MHTLRDYADCSQDDDFQQSRRGPFRQTGLCIHPAELRAFAAILERRPSRLFLTHFGYAENPAEHIDEFRRRLHGWAELAAEILRSASSESEAKEAFVARAQAEMQERLGADEAEHHAFTAGLDLSFLGLARYLRKRAEATA